MGQHQSEYQEPGQMVKRGLSLQEKRDKMLNVFHETKEAFNLKEVEKFSVKLGLPLPTVKEVLDMLVADDLVIVEKIGSGNYYWSFPSQAYQNLANRMEVVKGDIDKSEKEIAELEAKLAAAKVGKEECEERTKLNTELAEKKKEFDVVDKELKTLERNDPKRLEEMRKNNKAMADKTNNITDNVLVARKWMLEKNAGMDEPTFNKHFGIDANFDSI